MATNFGNPSMERIREIRGISSGAPEASPDPIVRPTTPPTEAGDDSLPALQKILLEKHNVGTGKVSDMMTGALRVAELKRRDPDFDPSETLDTLVRKYVVCAGAATGLKLATLVYRGELEKLMQQ